MKETDLLGDVFQAYFDARKHKRNTNSQLAFEMDCEHNLLELYEEIRQRTYTPSRAVCFLVHHPVKREIFASQFRDRVVHHLLYNYLAPIFESRLIYDCYSCRKGKGTSFGIDRFEHHVRSCSDNYRKQAWVLKLDVKGYFMSINRHKLHTLVIAALEKYWMQRSDDGRRKGDNMDKETILYLLHQTIYRDPTSNCEVRGNRKDWNDLPPSKSLLRSPQGVGMPIGDLTSQLFSNVYMHELDVFVKRTLCCKHYGRYVDDFFIVHESKTYLKDLIPVIRDFLWDELGLTLHPNKIYLQECRKGTPFLGCVLKPYRRYAANRSIKSFNKAVNRMSETIKEQNSQNRPMDKQWLVQQRSVLNSYLGYLSGYKSRKIVFGRLIYSPILQYFNLPSDCRRVIMKKTETPPQTENRAANESDNVP
ncbi:MAG: RNA-directed DNA polymerase [Mediterranea sp.]|jgi:retron-type reverse transcriptase|nr:RNA-directed DNA polymerase [Mediterranea sp.]